MPKTNDLEHVFMPIWEPVDAWYVMLLDVKALKIYALDVSRSPESIVRRESNMNKIRHALGNMFIHSRNIINFRYTSPDPSNWGNYIYSEGLPKDLQRVWPMVLIMATTQRGLLYKNIPLHREL
ncbi:uncharacterized protein LOC107621897 isoform X2 [Arachis ipaensis]|nr:uncharacterized protein LOC107621897 isoform X2 [Arachis ipaensis]XP_020969444.1 uncharacterized protein LOC107621897 isoform X2 [Arachis ipaensis]